MHALTLEPAFRQISRQNWNICHHMLIFVIICLHLSSYIHVVHTTAKRDLGPVSRKSRELFGPEKPFVQLRPAYSVKLVFSYVVKGIKIKITAKFRASRRLRFEDTERIVTRNTPEKFRDFRETGCKMSKNGKCSCKACKSNVFHCQICKFVTFLLPK